MRLEKHTHVFLMLLIPFTVSAQIEVSKIEKPNDSDKGLFYRLPQSHIVVDFKVKKTIFKAGEFSKYSEKLLGLSNVPQTDSTYWELQNVEILNYSTADPNESYILNCPNGDYPKLSFSSNGLLVAVNSKEEVRYNSTSLPEEEKARTVTPFMKDGKNLLGEDFLLAGSTPKMAEVAAKQIYTIRENRQDLLSGVLEQMPKEAEALKFLSNSLDEQELLLTALFTGNRQEEIYTFRYEIPSLSKGATTTLLTRFSKHLGLVNKEDLSGEPITIQTKVDLPTPLTTTTDNAKSKGIIYFLPSTVTMAVKLGEKTLTEKQFGSTQFAEKATLPSNMFSNPKTLVRLLLHPETGAIAEIQNEPIINTK